MRASFLSCQFCFSLVLIFSLVLYIMFSLSSLVYGGWWWVGMVCGGRYPFDGFFVVDWWWLMVSGHEVLWVFFFFFYLFDFGFAFVCDFCGWELRLWLAVAVAVGVSLSLWFGCALVLGLWFGFGFGFVCDFGSWELRLWLVVAVVVGVVCGSGCGQW